MKKKEEKDNEENKKRNVYKLNSRLKEVKDVWDKWPVKSQIYRYNQLLLKEEELVQDFMSQTREDNFQTRFLFQNEQERNEFTREMLKDLKFKVLFFLHILIENQDRDAVMFALKEMLQKGFVEEEIDRLDDQTLNQLQTFFEEKTSS